MVPQREATDDRTFQIDAPSPLFLHGNHIGSCLVGPASPAKPKWMHAELMHKEVEENEANYVRVKLGTP